MTPDADHTFEYEITGKRKQALDRLFYVLLFMYVLALFAFFPPVNTLGILLWSYGAVFSLLVVYRPGWWLCGVVVTICTFGFIPHLFGVFNAPALDGSIVSVDMFGKVQASGFKGRVISFPLLGLAPSIMLWWLREKRVIIPKAFVPMAAFGLLVIGSSIAVCLSYFHFSITPPYIQAITPDFLGGLKNSKEWWQAGMPYSLMAFTITLTCANTVGIALFVACYNLLSGNVKNLNMVHVAVAVSAVITTAYGLMQMKGYVPSFNAAIRFESTFQSQGCYGVFVGISCVYFLSRLFLSRRRTALDAALLVVSFCGLFINKSRTAFISIIITFFVLYAFHVLLKYKKGMNLISGMRKPLLVMLMAVTLVSLYALYIPRINHEISSRINNPFIGRIAQTFDTNEGGIKSAFSDRMAIWKKSLEIWRENPFLGCGEGQLYWELRKQKLTDTAANQFILVLAELGILGLALYVWVLGALFRELCRPFFSAARGKGYTGWLIWFAVVVSVITQSFTIHILHFPNLPMLVWIIFSVALVCARKHADGKY